MFFSYGVDTTTTKALQKFKIPKEIISKRNKTGASYYLILDILQSYSNQNDIILAFTKDTVEWKRLGNLEINPCTYIQLIVYTPVKNTQHGKEVYSICGAVKTKYSAVER